MHRRQFMQSAFLTVPLFNISWIRKPSFRALFVTDMHLSPDIDRSRRAGEYLLEYIKKSPEIDIIINGGDSVYDVAKLKYPEGEKLWQYWTSFKNQISIPVYNCLGNHDIYEWELSPETLIDPAQNKKTALTHLSMPGNYYSFKMGKWKFIVLDSMTYVTKGYKGALDSDQREWLSAELEKDTDHRVALISHIPILSACASLYLDADKSYLYPKIAERLVHTDAPAIFDSIKKRKIDLFLHGHLHMQESIQYKGTTIYNGGAFCADMWRGPFHGFKGCFTLIDFPDEGVPVISKIDLPDQL